MSNDASAPPAKQMNYIPAGVSEQMAKRSDQPPEKKSGLFLIERFKENPFVFAGLAVTVGALVRGVGTMTKGDELQQNRMMRLRIGGQAFTVAAFVAGCALGWHGPVIETVERWKMRHGYPPHPMFQTKLDRDAAARAWNLDGESAAK